MKLLSGTPLLCKVLAHYLKYYTRVEVSYATKLSSLTHKSVNYRKSFVTEPPGILLK